MVKLATLFDGNLGSRIGPAISTQRFIEYRNDFLAQGIEPIVCSLDGVHIQNVDDKSFETKRIENISTVGAQMKTLIRHGLLRSYPGTALLLGRSVLHSKRFVNTHDETIRQADVILTHDLFAAYYITKLYPDKTHVFMTHSNGEPLRQNYMDRPYLRKGKVHLWMEQALSIVYQQAHRIAFISKTAQEYFKSVHPDYAGKTVYIANGMEDIARLHIHYEDPLRLVAVGTVKKRKNQIAIIRAMEKLQDDNIYLTIIGGGDQYEEYRQHAESHHVRNVEFLGAIEHSKITDYLARSNCFISASLDEGLPMSGVEALRSSLPMIMTDVGGCREQISGNGYLVPADDPEALTMAIRKMKAASAAARMDMGKASRALYEREFTIDVLVRTYKAMVEDLKNDGLG